MACYKTKRQDQQSQLILIPWMLQHLEKERAYFQYVPAHILAVDHSSHAPLNEITQLQHEKKQ